MGSFKNPSLQISIMSSFLIRRLGILHPHYQLHPTFVHRLIFSTSLQGRVSSSFKEDHDDSNNSEPVIPMVPKRRDPDIVLKALASTVQPITVPLHMGGRNLADPLYPRGRMAHMNYTQHLEAGRSAAQYIIQRWPKMFPDRKTDPYQKRPKQSGKSLLERLIVEREASKAWSLYITLRRTGKRIPLSIENDLLELVSYEGLGNPLSSSPDTSDSFVQWPPASNPNAAAAGSSSSGKQAEVKRIGSESGDSREPGPAATSREATSNTEQDTAPVQAEEQENKIRIWSVKNIPEIMFSKMKKKDGRTYGALIQGLVKFNRYGRAFEIFQEMRTKGLQANVGTYNILLSTLKGNHVFNIAKPLVEQMNSEPVVQPDITTMNHLMRVTSKVGTASKAMTVKTMREIVHLGLEPTLATFVRLLMAFSTDKYRVTPKEQQEVLEQVVEYLERNKQLLTLQEKLDLIFFVQAFTIAKQVGSSDLALRLKALADTNHYFLVDNLNLVMSKYLSTLLFDAPFETTMAEYRQLVPKMFVPLEWLYRELFRICDKHQSAEDALQLWRDMRRFRVPIYKEETLNSFCGAISHSVPQEYVSSYIRALEQVWERFEEFKLKPSGILITTLVRLHAYNNDLDEAWRYYGHFSQNPSFMALVALLQKHNSLGDKEKTVEVLEIMINLKMSLPLRFVKDMLGNVDIDEGTRRRLLSSFSSNKKSDDEEVEFVIQEPFTNSTTKMDRHPLSRDASIRK